ncbi:MAG: thioredoxin family protein [Cetobacterium sp.]
MLKLPGYYFVFFTQKTCQYCHTLKPVFDKLDEMTTGCKFVYVDVDQLNQRIVSMSYKTKDPIEYVPLLRLYVDGKCVDTFLPDEQNPSNNLVKMSNFLLSHSKNKSSAPANPHSNSHSYIPPYSIGIPGNRARQSVCYIQPNKK